MRPELRLRLHESIQDKLQRALAPVQLEVINESGMHAVAPGSETHFRVRVVSTAFAGKTLLQRHRMIYELLEPERRAGIHALGIQALTPEELEASPDSRIDSPPCLGGDGQAGA